MTLKWIKALNVIHSFVVLIQILQGEVRVMTISQMVLFIHEHSSNCVLRVRRSVGLWGHVSCFMELPFTAASGLQYNVRIHDTAVPSPILYSARQITGYENKLANVLVSPQFWYEEWSLLRCYDMWLL
jgi:hypothetical protein